MFTFDWNFRKHLHLFKEQGRLNVLLCIAMHANERGRCWASQKTIAAETGFSIKTVNEAVAWLLNHKCLRLVDYNQRIDNEYQVPVRQYIYEITGKVVINEGQSDEKIIPYRYGAPAEPVQDTTINPEPDTTSDDGEVVANTTSTAEVVASKILPTTTEVNINKNKREKEKEEILSPSEGEIVDSDQRTCADILLILKGKNLLKKQSDADEVVQWCNQYGAPVVMSVIKAKLPDAFSFEYFRKPVHAAGKKAIIDIDAAIQNHTPQPPMPPPPMGQSEPPTFTPPITRKSNTLKEDVSDMITASVTHAVMGQWALTRDDTIKKNRMVSYGDTHLVNIELNKGVIEIQVTCNPDNLVYLESEPGQRHIQSKIIQAVIFSGDYSPNRDDYRVRFIPLDEWVTAYQVQEAG